MALTALTTDQVQELNWRGPFTGMGDRIALMERAGYLKYQFWHNPLLGTTTGAHAAVTDNGAPQTITTGFVQPDFPRNVTATAGGTATDIKAIQVVVNGTDYSDSVLQETLPVFTVDTAGTVTGSKAFKTITSIVIPAHDGTGATTALGYGAKLGFNTALVGNSVILGTADGVYETTRPTIAFSATAIASNMITFNTALDGAKDFMVLFMDMRSADVAAT